MFRRIVGTNIIKRFNQTHSKTTFPENNKTIENLLREQNNHLDNISQQLTVISIILTFTQITIALKK
jgi:hypothetical protein